MIAIIRITGQVGVNKDVDETLFRMRLRKKYAMVFLKHNEENLRFLNKIRNFTAYGEVSDELLHKIITARAKPIGGKKIDATKVAKEIKDGKIESIKPFITLHPPRGGADTKVHYPKGILGNNGKEISKLIERML